MKTLIEKFPDKFDPEKSISDILEDIGTTGLSHKQIDVVTKHLQKLREEGKLTQETVKDMTLEFQTLGTTGLAPAAKSMAKNIGLNLVASAAITGITALIGALGKEIVKLAKTQENIIETGRKASEEIFYLHFA